MTKEFRVGVVIGLVFGVVIGTLVAYGKPCLRAEWENGEWHSWGNVPDAPRQYQQDQDWRTQQGFNQFLRERLGPGVRPAQPPC